MLVRYQFVIWGGRKLIFRPSFFSVYKILIIRNNFKETLNSTIKKISELSDVPSLSANDEYLHKSFHKQINFKTTETKKWQTEKK